MAVSETRTVELTGKEAIAVRDAIVEEMVLTCKIIRGHLREHLGGSHVGLADARSWAGTLAMFAGVMDKLDPPGWKDTLGPSGETVDEVLDELEHKRQVS